MKKRILSMVLVFVLVLGMLPLSAFAANSYKFTQQPTAVPDDVFSWAYIDWDANFTPIKSVIYIDGVEKYTLTNSDHIKNHYTYNELSKGAYTVRLYYGKGTNDYIESEKFYLDLKFTKQPTAVPDDIFSWAYIEWEDNFNPLSGPSHNAAELYCDGVKVDDGFENWDHAGGHYTFAGMKTGNYTLRVYYGEGANDYIESDPFKLDIKFTKQPTAVPSERLPNSVEVTWEDNFRPLSGSDHDAAVLYCNGVEVDSGLSNWKNVDDHWALADMMTGAYTLRVYYGEGANDYIESEKFYVGKGLLSFKDQNPAMPLGETTQWIESKVGKTETFTFNNENVPDGFTVEKYVSLKGCIAGLLPGDTPIEVTETTDGKAVSLTHTFEKSGIYQLTERLTFKDSSGNEYASITNTFNILVNDVVIPEITEQPKSVHGKTQGTAVTLSATAQKATSAKWYRLNSDGTVTGLTTDFNTSTGVATTTQYAGSNNEANYFCAFWSKDGKIAQTNKVTICVMPSVTNGATVTVSPGGTAFLRVTETGCNHYATETGWYAPGSSVEVSGNKYYTMGTTLAIQNVTNADAGTYTYKYVTSHGETATGTVTLVVEAPTITDYINTFELYMDEPVFGKAAPTQVTAPSGAGYRVKSVTWTGGVGNGIITSSSATVRIVLEVTGSKQFKGNSSGDIVGSVNSITKYVYGVNAATNEITVTIDYGAPYQSFKLVMPKSDTASVTTEKLTFEMGQEYTASDYMKITGTVTCDHNDLAAAYQHTGMTYSLESTTEDNAMPAGLTLNTDGSITGTPTKAGTYTVVILAHSVNSTGTASTGCGHVVKTITIEVTHEHNWVKKTTTATCTKGGEATYKCGCGETTTGYDAATGHTYGEWTETNAPSCMTAGEKTRTCSICTAGTEGHTETSAIPATGHTYGEWTETTAPSCMAAGEKTRTCSVCAAGTEGHTETSPILPIGHSAPNWSQDADQHWRVCENTDCGETIYTKENHVDGDTDFYCDICGYKMPVTYTVSFNVNGGTGTMADVTGISGEYTLPANGFTAPDGKQFKAWSVGGVEKAVGDKITVTADTTVTAVWEDIPAGHTCDIKPVAKDEPSCTEGGKEAYYKCEGCGKFYEDALGAKEITDLANWGNLPNLDHTESDWKSDKDNHWKECTVAACGVIIENSKTAHKDENKDGKCDVCEYNVGTPTTPTEPSKPSDNPQTGDNSIMWLWVALLFVSGAGVAATTVLGKKKFSVK